MLGDFDWRHCERCLRGNPHALKGDCFVANSAPRNDALTIYLLLRLNDFFSGLVGYASLFSLRGYGLRAERPV